MSNEKLKEIAAARDGFDTTSLKLDKGHPWDLLKYDFIGSDWNYTQFESGQPDRTYVHCVPDIGNYSSTMFPSLTLDNLQSFGTLAYGKSTPLSGEFNLAQFLGELHEGLPGIIPASIKKRAKILKNAGDDYLNVEFGWLPFVNDLRGLANALASATNGMFQPLGATHRSYGVPEVATYGSTNPTATNVSARAGRFDIPISSTPLFKHLHGGNILVGARLTATATTSFIEKRRMWFEGEFVYVPKAGFDPSSFMDRLSTLMSTDITPSVLWELTPWSWLVDWGLHIGSSLQAAEAASSNRILTSYAYAMETVERTHALQLTNIHPRFAGSYVGPSSYACTWTTTSRRRVRANPFGFASNPLVSLNGTQLGILAALGLTKSLR